MLYDPKWDKTPSLEGFRRFCESKPPAEWYNWSSDKQCACAQYFEEIGLKKEWRTRYRSPDHIKTLMQKLDLIAISHATFGELATALTKGN